MREKELERKEVMLDREIELLADRMEKFEAEVRKRFDDLDLEIKALQLYAEWAHPNTSKTLHDIRSRLFHPGAASAA